MTASPPTATWPATPHPSHISAKVARLQSSSPTQPFWSLEFFPPKTSQGSANLLARIARMNHALEPAWNNVTWGAGGTTQGKSLDLAGRCVAGLFDADVALTLDDNVLPGGGSSASAAAAAAPPPAWSDCCLHLTCTNVDKDSLDATLLTARRLGIRNILALRGDPPRGEEYWVAADARFQLATDLVRYIRSSHGDFFCVGVAAYPEGHCDSLDRDIDRDIDHLKLKQDAGAQFVITQLFYDVDVFIAWYKKCRAAGITIPILPGIMPIQNYQSFRRMTNLCRATVPTDVLQVLEPIRFDDAAVKDYGVQLAIHTIARLYLETDIRGFHLCTLNLEKSVTRVLQGLGWVDAGAEGGGESDITSTSASAPAPLKGPLARVAASEGITTRTPNKVLSTESGMVTPAGAEVSPKDYKATTAQALERVFTSVRPHAPGKQPLAPNTSATWDEFPNGRWGDARSPAFGEIDGYGVSLKVAPGDALRIWGTPTTDDEISNIFVRYLLGEIGCIPWCDAPIFEETYAIRDPLLKLNRPSGRNTAAVATDKVLRGKGWWTVGSQPAVDGVKSDNPTYGFGPPDGYVYQKAFVEFFASEEDKERLRRKALGEGSESPGSSSGPTVSFFAGNRAGAFESSVPPSSVEAVTWAVFPGKEIAQPTIIEEESFKAWRDEAFGIWAEWELLFPRGSPARECLRRAGEDRWLVTVVHHDFKDPGALWRWLLED